MYLHLLTFRVDMIVNIGIRHCTQSFHDIGRIRGFGGFKTPFGRPESISGLPETMFLHLLLFLGGARQHLGYMHQETM